jgi:DNA-binding NarL/FixJ family response regulator
LIGTMNKPKVGVENRSMEIGDNDGCLSEPMSVWKSNVHFGISTPEFREKIEKASKSQGIIQRMLEELRFEIGVDACVASKLVDEPNDPHLTGFAESIEPSSELGTRLIRQEIDYELLVFLRDNPIVVSELELYKHMCITIGDIQKISEMTGLAGLKKIWKSFPERSYASVSLTDDENILGVLVCSGMKPRSWQQEECEIIEEYATKISGVMLLVDSLNKEESENEKEDDFESVTEQISEEHLRVLDGIQRGLLNKEIAKEMGLPYRRVTHRVEQLFRISQTNTRTALTRWARICQVLERSQEENTKREVL